MAIGLPPEDDKQALKDSNYWRIMLGLPIPLLAI